MVDPCSPDSQDTISLASDDDVAALAALRCDTVWSLEITGTVTTLAGLETIRDVGNVLYVHDTGELENLKGLEGVEQAGLVIASNTGLVSLTGLGGMQVVTTLVIAQNVGLKDLGALTNASFADASLTITGNEGLPNLVGFEGMTEVGGMVLADNAGLESLQGLDNLQTGGSLTITNNPDLSDISLPNLQTTEYVTIANAESLGRVRLPVLEQAGGLVVATCPLLTELNLSALRTAGQLYVSDNATLADLGDLSALESVDTAAITENPMLSQCLVDAIAPLVTDCTCDGNGNGPCQTGAGGNSG
jgi:hypothetical protein